MIVPFLFALSALPLVLSRPQGLRERQAAGCTTKSIRKSWTDLSVAEKQSYIDADLCLMTLPAKHGIKGATSIWDELQYAHAAQVRYIHGVGAFLPFHRFFVTVHDQLLRAECDYTGPLPYWDEPSDVGDIMASPLFSEEPGFGGNGTGKGNCIEDGPFANLTLHFKEDLTTTDYCISRMMSDRAFSSGSRANVETCLKKTNFKDAWNCIEGAPHSSGHGGVSGTMMNLLLSPGDPVFYLHHGYLDRVWWEWQSRDLETRLSEISGYNIPVFNFPGGGFPGGGFGGGNGSGNGNGTGMPWPGIVMPEPNKAFEDYFNDGGNVTTLDHTLWMADIVKNATIADVMDGEGGIVCADYML